MGRPGLQEPFSVDVSRQGANVIVSVRGEVDLVTAPQLMAYMARVPGTSHRVTVDLEGVSFLSIFAARLLSECLFSAERAGLDIDVHCSNKRIRRIVDMAAPELLVAS